MAMPKDMTRANWGRTRRKLLRYADELRAAGATVTLPRRFDLPPSERLRSGGIIEGVPVIVGEHGPEREFPIAGTGVTKL